MSDEKVNNNKNKRDKFWMLNKNPITGFPPERLLYKHKTKPKQYDIKR
jgi:hypothetical protein